MTQGVYRSPKCVLKTSNGDTPFERDFIAYLTEYNLPQLKPIIAKIKLFDWSPCKVNIYSKLLQCKTVQANLMI